MHILSRLLVSLLLIHLSAGSACAQFGIGTPYEEAVPNFLETITQSVENILSSEQLEDVSDWHDANMVRMGEFLDDLSTIAQDLENNVDPDFVFTAYQGFVDKWDDVAASFPHFDEIAPTLSGHIDELFAGLPEPRSPKSYPIEANPMAALADHYNQLEQTDPWDLGGFFNNDLLLSETTVITESKTTHESKSGGMKNSAVLSQQSLIQNNGEVVYYNNVTNDVIQDRFVKYRPPTLVHEVLEESINDGIDPDVIARLQDIVNYMDDGLEEANQNDVLDDCSYEFVQRGTQMQLVSTCTDIQSNEQEFADMLDSDPFDWIKRPFLGYKE